MSKMSHNNHMFLPKYLQEITEKDVECLLASDKEVIKQFARWISEPSKVIALESQMTRLSQDNLRLRTVMFAAHEEIIEFWDARTYENGHGPQDLARHLREGTGYYPCYIDNVTKSKQEE